MNSPTTRSLARLKSDGWTSAIVEKWNPHARIRQDLFGCIDLVAVRPGCVLGVQACAGASHAARRTKAEEEPRLREWLRAGATFQVWSWSKQGPHGKRKLWTLRRETAVLTELGGIAWKEAE